MIFSALLIPVITATGTSSPEAAAIAEIVAGRDVLPSLEEAQRRVIERLDLSSEPLETWTSRMRARAWVPRVELRFGTDSDMELRDVLAADLRRTTSDARGVGFDLSLRWDLGALVFSPFEPRAHREKLHRAALVRRSLEALTRLYFERVEALLEERSGEGDPAELALRSARLDGQLRALLGRPETVRNPTGGEDR